MDTSSPPPLHGPTMNYFLFCDTCDDYGDDGYYYYDHDDYDDFGDRVRDDGSGLFFWRRLPHSLMIHKIQQLLNLAKIIRPKLKYA